MCKGVFAVVHSREDQMDMMQRLLHMKWCSDCTAE